VREHLHSAQGDNNRAEEGLESMIIEEYQTTATGDLGSGQDRSIEPEPLEQPALEPDEIEEPPSAPISRQATEIVAEEELTETPTKKSKKGSNKKGKKGKQASSASRMPVGVISQPAQNDDTSLPTEEQSLEDSTTVTPAPEPEDTVPEDPTIEDFTTRSGKKAKNRKKSKRASVASTPAEASSPAMQPSRDVDDIPTTQDEAMMKDEVMRDTEEPTEAQPDDEIPILSKDKGKRASKQSKRKSLSATPPVVEEAREAIQTSQPSIFAALRQPTTDEPQQVRPVDTAITTAEAEPTRDVTGEDFDAMRSKDFPEIDASAIPLPAESDDDLEKITSQRSVEPLPDTVQFTGAKEEETHGINLEESIGSVLRDPAFSRPRSRAGALDEPTYDELPLQDSRRLSRPMSRRSSRRESFDVTTQREPSGLTAESSSHPPDSDKEFVAALAAGLTGAGFDPSLVQEDKSYTERHPSPRELDDDNEGFSELHRRQTRGSNGKRNRTASPPQSQSEPPTVQHDEFATESFASHRDIVTQESEASSERPRISEGQGITEAALAAAAVGVAGLAATSLAAKEDHDDMMPRQGESSEASRSRSMTEPVSIPPNSADLPSGHSRRVSTEAISPTQVIPGRRRVSDMFPELERVKRKAPARTDTIIEQPTKRVSLGSGEEAIQRIISPRPSTSQLAAEPSLTKQVSAQDLAKPAWSWVEPENRDSAVIMDSPQVPQQHEAVRDSGYHDIPVTPSAANERDSSRKSRSSSRGSAKSPMKVQVEVSPGWNVSVEQSPPVHEDQARESITSADSLPRSAFDGVEYAEPERLPPSPPAVESTSKDRSSAALFESSPSTREPPAIALEFHEPVQWESTASPPSIFGPQETSRDGLTPYTPGAISHTRSPSMPLDTIHEDSPESPLAKKSRPLSDIGSDERMHKMAHRSDTPETLAEKRYQPGLHIFPLETDQRALSPSSAVSMGELIDNRDWPEVDEEKGTVEGIDQVLDEEQARRTPSSGNPSLIRESRKVSPMGDRRSPSVVSDKSIGRIKSPEHVRSTSVASTRSDRSLRRVEMSGDLRAASRLSGAGVRISATPQPPTPPIAGASTNERLKGIGRRISMEGVYVSFTRHHLQYNDADDENQEGIGDAPGSPMSPSGRPPSIRKRQSLHIIDLEGKLDQLTAENSQLRDAKARYESAAQDFSQDRELHATNMRQATDALASRDALIQEKDSEIEEIRDMVARLQQQVDQLAGENAQLTAQNQSIATDAHRFASLQAQSADAHSKWQESTRALEMLQQEHSELRSRHEVLNSGMEQIVRDEITARLQDRDDEISRLRQELNDAHDEIRRLSQEIASGPGVDSFLTVRSEDYIDSACNQLCQHVQQWVLRFSKFSDQRACRLSTELRDDKIEELLDDVMLDGSDVDNLLRDRVRRRDVFMSVVMSIIWKYVFSRYLFGLDREQRQRLKSLEGTLKEVGKCRNRYISSFAGC